MNKIDYYDILFDALNYAQASIPEHFRSKQMELSGVKTKQLFDAELRSHFENLKWGFQKNQYELQKEDLQIKKAGGSGTGVKELPLNPTHITNKSYAWNSPFPHGFGSKEVAILEAAISEYMEPVKEASKAGFICNLNDKQIKTLYHALKVPASGFIDAHTDIDNFKAIFSQQPKEKVIWLKRCKNKHPNKLSLCELFVFLNDRELFVYSNAKDLLKFIPEYFTSTKEELKKFSYSNLPTEIKYSEHYTTLKDIVDTL